MTRYLPRPVTESGEFLAAIHDRLGEQNELLGRILDRLPKPVSVEYTPTVQVSGPVELREPAPSGSTSTDPEGVSVEEPAPAKPATKRTRKPRPKVE